MSSPISPLTYNQAQQQSSGTSSSSSSSGASANSASASLGGVAPTENTFLTLLVAQLKNQDPLSPTDSTQFVSELAQFSQLEQTITINQNVGALTQKFAPSATTSSSGSTSGTNGTSGTSASSGTSGSSGSSGASGTSGNSNNNTNNLTNAIDNAGLLGSVS